MIQKECDVFNDGEWNVHRIRPQKNAVLPHGVPNNIFNFPEKYGLQDCGLMSLHICYLWSMEKQCMSVVAQVAKKWWAGH